MTPDSWLLLCFVCSIPFLVIKLVHKMSASNSPTPNKSESEVEASHGSDVYSDDSSEESESNSSCDSSDVPDWFWDSEEKGEHYAEEGMKTYDDQDEAQDVDIPQFLPNAQPGLVLKKDTPEEVDPKLFTPGAFFKLFFTPELVQQICNYTNENFSLSQAAISELKPAIVEGWEPLTPDEFYVFLALILYFSAVRIPCLELYWATEGFIRGKAGLFMSSERYQQIQAFLRVYDPKQGNGDKLAQIKTLSEPIRLACMQHWVPNERINVNERTVAPSKATKLRLKIWALSDSLTGYVCNFDIQVGKQEKPKTTIGYDVVMNLCSHLSGMGYKLYIDIVSTSVKLFKDLLDQGIVACGTIKSTEHFPKTFSNLRVLKKSKRGSMRWDREGPIGFIQWKAFEIVNMITTMHKSINEGTVCPVRAKLNNKGRRLEARKPAVIADFVKNTVDEEKAEWMIDKCQVLCKTNLSWKIALYHMIDIAIDNSFAMFQNLREREKSKNLMDLVRSKKYDRNEFVLDVFTELNPVPEFTGSVGCSHTCRHPITTESAGYCYVCYRVEKVCRESNTMCRKCELYFCFNEDRSCLTSYHVED